MKKFNNFVINQSHLVNNVKNIKSYVGNNVLVCAMVKANAYGHGIKGICSTIKNYVDYFGVATLCEAKEIRSFDKTTPILIVGLTSIKYINWCAKNNVSVTINTLEEIEEINKTLTSKNLKIHFKVNTGLNRIGFNSKKVFIKAFNLANKNPKIICQGIFTHFATKEKDIPFIEKQMAQFKEYVSLVKNQKLIIHCCNSFASLNLKECHFNMVRCGFAIYGWQKSSNVVLKPILKVSAKLLAVHAVKKGETVGYDREYTAQNNIKVGVVSLGYADGFDRRNSNNAKVLVNGKFVSVIGNVCMDVFMVNLNGVKNAKVGDDVIIIGESGNKKITPQMYAAKLNTNPYEILLKLNYKRMNYIIEKENESQNDSENESESENELLN